MRLRRVAVANAEAARDGDAVEVQLLVKNQIRRRKPRARESAADHGKPWKALRSAFVETDIEIIQSKRVRCRTIQSLSGRHQVGGIPGGQPQPSRDAIGKTGLKTESRRPTEAEAIHG